MKKYLSIISILCLMSILFVGCAKNGAVGGENNSPTTPEQSAKNNPEKQEQKSDTAIGGVDVDLTALSSTMVYAEVYNMTTSPDDYMGKTIKMSGPYYASFYDETDSYYHYVIIEDAAACCQSGLEFIWNGEHNYPNDYPTENTKIEVSGVFGSYEELGQTYYYLAVDEITVL